MVALVSPPIYLVPEGESRVFRLERPIARVAVGDPTVADYILINPSELYLLGKKTGATNLVVWDRNGYFISTPLQVSRNVIPIKELLKTALPKEHDIHIYARGSALVLDGIVSDALAAETACRLVKAYLGSVVPEENPEATLTNRAAANGSPESATISGINTGGSRPTGNISGTVGSGSGSGASAKTRGLVNLLKVRDPQQVRLEVHIAEVSKSYIESLGLGWIQNSGNTQGSLMTGFVSNATLDLLLQVHHSAVPNNLGIEAERKKSLIKILAEPTMVAMSGKEGYFLVGGKIYTPTIGTYGQVDYVERTYGVGLRLTPTVLDGGRISLRVAPEVSEPNTEPVTAGTQLNLPAFKISYASTTVQMNEGENLVIGGLLKDNLTEIIRAVPLLGDIPLFGTLFRRTEKNAEKTELLVVIRPTLVKASTTAPELPTDKIVPATNGELFIGGKLQSSRGEK